MIYENFNLPVEEKAAISIIEDALSERLKDKFHQLLYTVDYMAYDRGWRENKDSHRQEKVS